MKTLASCRGDFNQVFHQVFKALFDIVLSLDHDHDREIKTAANKVNFNHTTAKKL